MSYYCEIKECSWLSAEATKARMDAWKRSVKEYKKAQRRKMELKEIEERVAEYMRIKNMYNRFEIMEFD